MNAEKNMTPRLLAISACVTKDAKIADIGTDHAYIPIYLIQNGKIPSALAMDINVGPLERAKNNIQKFGYEQLITTRLSDGLLMLGDDEVDEVVIAGMGGILISEILDARKDLKDKNLRFILQPMTAAEELRKYLEKNGFLIEFETLAKEENKLYQILIAKKGRMEMKREADYYISPYLLEHQAPYTKELLELRIKEFEKMLSGLKESRRGEMQSKQEYAEKLLDELYAIRKECKRW